MFSQRPVLNHDLHKSFSCKGFVHVIFGTAKFTYQTHNHLSRNHDNSDTTQQKARPAWSPDANPQSCDANLQNHNHEFKSKTLLH